MHKLLLIHTKKVAILMALFFAVSGCVATTSARVVDTPQITQTLFDGRTTNVSSKANTTLTFTSLTNAAPNSDEIELLLVADVRRGPGFTLSTDIISATVDDAPAKVFTYDELRAAEIRSRNIALFATALGGAAQAMSASQPQTTTGTFNSYGGGMGTFTSTTYNPSQAAMASAAASANTSAQIDSISSNSEQRLSALENSYLKPTTMNRGIRYGGVVRIEVPRLQADSSQTIEVSVRLGSDVHSFQLLRTFDPTN